MDIKFVVTIKDGEEFDSDELRRVIGREGVTVAENLGLRNTNKLLGYELKNLQASYRLLEAKNEKLVTSLEEWQIANWDFRVKNEKLQAENEDLLHENTVLEVVNKELSEEHNTLQAKYERLGKATRNLLTCEGGVDGGPCAQCKQIARELVMS